MDTMIIGVAEIPEQEEQRHQSSLKKCLHSGRGDETKQTKKSPQTQTPKLLNRSLL